VSKVLATYNIKGGVGKTSAAVNLAYLAARDGFPTLVWDLDPQGAATYLFRVRPKVRGGGRRLMRLRTDVTRLIKGTDHPGLDLLPSDFSYRHLDLVLNRFKRPTTRLKRRSNGWEWSAMWWPRSRPAPARPWPGRPCGGT
jgi:chromosome partitioning protein